MEAPTGGGMGKFSVFIFVFHAVLFGLSLYCSSSMADPRPEAYAIISDIDDTIKITHVPSPHLSRFSWNHLRSYYDALRNGIYGKQVFVGMKELLKELGGRADRVTYLSGAPQKLEFYTHELLVKENGFPEGGFVFNNWWQWKNSMIFKKEQLPILAGEAQLPVILIGDDTEYDPEVYSEFSKADPSRTLKIYIHRVVGRELPEGVYPFSTAFEVALLEMSEGRLRSDQVIQVGKAILDSSHPEDLFPFFKNCPQGMSEVHSILSAATEEVRQLAENLEQFVLPVCHTAWQL